jgi:acyl-CoA reductase-like NAD-dependent aldehyde dehydrogenase
MLCNHPLVSKLSFTGSLGTSQHILAAASSKLIPVTLELGGKSPLIIFEDAHLANAVKAALLANFLSQGEVCSNGTRVFVHEKIFDEFLSKVVQATRNLKIGDPMSEDTVVGATINGAHAEKVLGFVTRAVSEGAKVECGGERVILPEPFSKGHFLSPCVLSNVQDHFEIVKEEVFGAVMCLLKFSSEEEVVHRANDTKFGLAGAVFTRDVQRAFRIADKVKAGTFWINNYNVYPPEVPFGGYKFSGIGRENGLQVFDHYTQTKSVFFEAGDVDCGPLMY